MDAEAPLDAPSAGLSKMLGMVASGGAALALALLEPAMAMEHHQISNHYPSI